MTPNTYIELQMFSHGEVLLPFTTHNVVVDGNYLEDLWWKLLQHVHIITVVNGWHTCTCTSWKLTLVYNCTLLFALLCNLIFYNFPNRMTTHPESFHWPVYHNTCTDTRELSRTLYHNPVKCYSSLSRIKSIDGIVVTSVYNSPD
jgi:hypothetical protein